MTEPRFYRYILRHDDGWAPCTDNGLLSLATCKPKIRRTARIGDYVAGYQPKAKGEGLLCWFGRIEKITCHADYSKAYPGRSDANYERNSSGRWRRRNPLYHPLESQLRADVKAPVLLFDMTATWYFGLSPQQPPQSLARLRAIGQGHRVKKDRLPNDLDDMLDWLRGSGPPGILHPPRDQEPGCGSSCGPVKKKPLRNRC